MQPSLFQQHGSSFSLRRPYMQIPDRWFETGRGVMGESFSLEKLPYKIFYQVQSIPQQVGRMTENPGTPNITGNLNYDPEVEEWFNDYYLYNLPGMDQDWLSLDSNFKILGFQKNFLELYGMPLIDSRDDIALEPAPRLLSYFSASGAASQAFINARKFVTGNPWVRDDFDSFTEMFYTPYVLGNNLYRRHEWSEIKWSTPIMYNIPSIINLAEYGLTKKNTRLPQHPGFLDEVKETQWNRLEPTVFQSKRGTAPWRNVNFGENSFIFADKLPFLQFDKTNSFMWGWDEKQLNEKNIKMEKYPVASSFLRFSDNARRILKEPSLEEEKMRHRKQVNRELPIIKNILHQAKQPDNKLTRETVFRFLAKPEASRSVEGLPRFLTKNKFFGNVELNVHSNTYSGINLDDFGYFILGREFTASVFQEFYNIDEFSWHLRKDQWLKWGSGNSNAIWTEIFNGGVPPIFWGFWEWSDNFGIPFTFDQYISDFIIARTLENALGWTDNFRKDNSVMSKSFKNWALTYGQDHDFSVYLDMKLTLRGGGSGFWYDPKLNFQYNENALMDTDAGFDGIAENGWITTHGIPILYMLGAVDFTNGFTGLFLEKFFPVWALDVRTQWMPILAGIKHFEKKNWSTSNACWYFISAT